MCDPPLAKPLEWSGASMGMRGPRPRPLPKFGLMTTAWSTPTLGSCRCVLRAGGGPVEHRPQEQAPRPQGSGATRPAACRWHGGLVSSGGQSGSRQPSSGGAHGYGEDSPDWFYLGPEPLMAGGMGR